jgi:hypothetical protein
LGPIGHHRPNYRKLCNRKLLVNAIAVWDVKMASLGEAERQRARKMSFAVRTRAADA